MGGSKRLFVLLGIIALMVLALGAFYLWLNGGRGTDEEAKSGRGNGLIPVRSIYVYGDGLNLQKPVGLGADDQGNFFVTLRDIPAVVEFDRGGDYVRHWGTHGLKPGEMMAPLGVAVDRLADHVYVVDRSRLRLICYDGRGTYLWETPVLNPLNVAVGSKGQVYVTTYGPIAEFTSEGEYVKQVGSRGRVEGQFDYPRAVTFNSDGSAFIADSNNARVQRVKMSGELTASVEWVLGRPPRHQQDAKTRFTVPSGLDLDTRGRVVVLDAFKHQIEMLDPTSRALLTNFGGERRGPGDGMFNMPTSITRLYADYYAISDTYNDRVQIVRLIGPGEVNPLVLYPWLKWLALLLLIPLARLFGRKRAFMTSEALRVAVDEGNAKLVLAVFGKLRVLPETMEEFADVTEDDVRIGDYLEEVDAPEQVDEDGNVIELDLDAEERLAQAAARTRIQRFLFARHIVVCVDEDQCERIVEKGADVVPYEQLLEEYAIDGETEVDAA